mmetsp:Transcript_161228/g.517613  ORF Transcript_161228/g.517613 Transcript_161228/m.517613 type:complete len:154 (-) Transcript_161228:116-577(-)
MAHDRSRPRTSVLRRHPGQWQLPAASAKLTMSCASTLGKDLATLNKRFRSLDAAVSAVEALSAKLTMSCASTLGKDLATLNKRFRSLDAAVSAVEAFYEDESGMEIDKTEVMQAVREDGTWADEQIVCDDSGRYHRDDAACHHVMHSSIAVVQ